MKKTKYFYFLKKHQEGFSLLEVTVAVGVLAIMAWVMIGAITTLANENKSLSEKLESIELEQSINRLTTESSVCSCIVPLFC